MKKNSLFLVFSLTLIFISLVLSASVQIHSFEDIKSLSRLSQAFFSKKEYVGGAVGTDTVLSQCAFDGAVNAFSDKFLSYTDFKNKNNWIGNAVKHPVKKHKGAIFVDKHGTDYVYAQNDTLRYIQKLKVSEQAIICFMGDFHGSVHSLIRNLWRLVALGYLNEDLTIKNPNFYMVFLGDYVDRGRWGVEVVTMLLKLKTQSWDNVHLLAGNHETGGVSLHYGFFKEIKNKFGDDTSFRHVYEKVFMNLPVALFIECNGNFIQCCHGGIEQNVKPLDFFKDSSKYFQNVGSEDHCAGLFWSDFCAGSSGCKPSKRGVGIEADQLGTANYLKNNAGLKAIMHAHMDMEFGLKLFLDPSRGSSCDRSIQTLSYKKPCLYHWTAVAQRLGITGNRFSLATFDYYPVFTFTSAVEAREFPFDCFGLVNTASTWDQWMMEVYELFLDVKGDNHRHEKFVHVGMTSSDVQTNLVMPSDLQGKDPIAVVWRDQLASTKLQFGMEAIIKHGKLQAYGASGLDYSLSGLKI